MWTFWPAGFVMCWFRNTFLWHNLRRSSPTSGKHIQRQRRQTATYLLTPSIWFNLLRRSDWESKDKLKCTSSFKMQTGLHIQWVTLLNTMIFPTISEQPSLMASYLCSRLFWLWLPWQCWLSLSLLPAPAQWPHWTCLSQRGWSQPAGGPPARPGSTQRTWNISSIRPSTHLTVQYDKNNISIKVRRSSGLYVLFVILDQTFPDT